VASESDPSVFIRSPPDADRPIASPDQDRLQRTAFADALATQIAAADDDGLVIALTGPWGSGKTSLLNLTDNSLRASGVVVVRFNPWFFSGTENLVRSFFDELGAQLSETPGPAQALGAQLKRYGAILRPLRFIPVAGTWADRAGELATIVGDAVAKDDRSLHRVRADLEGELEKAGERIVVMIDDIDRLTKDEIREVMQLVRLVGEFPRIVYVLAFDPGHVAAALSDGEPEQGRRYLEKIVQLAYEVPAISDAELMGLLREVARRVLDSPSTEADAIVHTIVAPLVTNIRDVRRYANVLPFALHIVGDEVNPVDVLALEAIRLFRPAWYERIPAVADLLTATKLASIFSEGTDDPEHYAMRTRLQGFVDGGGNEELAEALFELVFPPAAAMLAGHGLDPALDTVWRRDRRVASQAVLRIYFEKALPGHVAPSAVVEELADGLASRRSVGPLLDVLSGGQLRDALSRLPVVLKGRRERGELDVDDQAVARWLIDLLDRCAKDSSFALPRQSVIATDATDVTIAALGQLESAGSRCAAAELVVKDVEDPLVRLRFLQAIGQRPVVDDACTARLVRIAADRLLGLDARVLARQSGLAELLDWIGGIGSGILDSDRGPRLEELLGHDAVFAQYLATYAPQLQRRPPLFAHWRPFRTRVAELRKRARNVADIEAALANATAIEAMLDEEGD
jgi:KAP-like P-loop domain-containing protein